MTPEESLQLAELVDRCEAAVEWNGYQIDQLVRLRECVLDYREARQLGRGRLLVGALELITSALAERGLYLFDEVAALVAS